ASDRQHAQLVADIHAEAEDRTTAFDAQTAELERVATRSEAGDGVAGIDREVMAVTDAEFRTDPAILAEAVADVHSSDAREDVAVAVLDVEVETITTTAFGTGVLAQREVLGIDFGANVQATEVLLVGCATGSR